MKQEIQLDVEQLEERIAPSATGSLGYEGQPETRVMGNKAMKASPETKAATDVIVQHCRPQALT